MRDIEDAKNWGAICFTAIPRLKMHSWEVT